VRLPKAAASLPQRQSEAAPAGERLVITPIHVEKA
jgi:hypothetical protein